MNRASGETVRLVCGGVSHVGRRREANEDCLLVAPEIGLLAVADGMGGHAAGEVASRIVIDTLQESVRETGMDTRESPSGTASPDRLREAIRLANDRIFQSIEGREELRGMGTTVVAALVRDDRLAVGYVGDSRAYLLRDGALTQLTADHSWVQEQVELGLLSPSEAHRHPFRNIVTRALGSRDVIADIREERLRLDDVLLLCSDGLNSMVEDDAIRSILARPTAVRQTAEALVEAANEAGGEDNITVIVARAERAT